MAKLTRSGTKLLLGGQELLGHIGFNSFFPFENAIIAGATDWQTAIDIARSSGALVMRVPMGPRYKNDLETYVHTFSSPNWTLRASYITAFTAILDYAASKGMSLLCVPFWRAAAAADIASAGVSTLSNPTSTARDYMRQILAQYITQFGAHSAFAGWGLFNEYDQTIYTTVFGAPSYVWGINVAKGSPATYSSGSDVVTGMGLRDMCVGLAGQIKTARPNDFVISGNVGPSPTSSCISWFKNQSFLYPSELDAISWHSYLDDKDGQDRTPESMGMHPGLMVRGGNRPIIIDEFGIQPSGASLPFTNDPDGLRIPIVYAGYRENKAALALEWQLCPIAQDSIYGIWSGEARGNQRLSIIAALNSVTISGSWAPITIASAPPFDQCARFNGSGATSVVTVTNTAVINPTTFSVSLWARPTLATSGSTRRIISKVTTAAGWYFGIDPSPAGNIDMRDVFGALTTNNAGTGVDVTTLGGAYNTGLNRWDHYVMTFDGTYIRWYLNSIHYGTLKTLTYPWTPATSNLLIGNGTVAFVGEIQDVRLYAGAITHKQIIRVGLNTEPAQTLGWWKLDGDALDYSGNGNNGAVGAAASFVAAKPAARAVRA